MIKACGGTPGRRLYLIGLTRANLRELRNGRPIAFDAADINLPNGKVLIMYGETEAAMVNELNSHGLIGPSTEIRKDT